MSEAKHTPGPWEFGSGDDYYVRADAYPKDFPHKFKSDDLGDYLAYVGNRTDDFGEANARLIAAAPELLAAAEKQEAAEAFHLACVECEGNEIPELCEACFPHYDDARLMRRAAIAKAEGQI